MQTQREIAIHKIGELIQISKDAEMGFQKAAAETHDLSTRAKFRMTAQERADFANELQDAMRKRLGAQPPEGGSFIGLLHRAWMALRYQLTLHNEAAVKKECLRGEEVALGVYQDLFWDKVVPDLEPMLNGQYVKIIEMRDMLRQQTHHDPEKPEKNILLL